VGGHQASSASIVDIMVALWFHALTADDRVSVKPHAAPVLHAINYLLGDLDAKYLTTLRSQGVLQSYPSRIKDPDTVDFSTGSVGIGATAALWAAIAHRYVESHFADAPPAGRFISLLGDAELDEGAIWEAVADPQVASLGELLWVFVMAITASMVGLAYAMRTLPVGTAYAVWVGIRAALTVFYGMTTGSEPVSLPKILLLVGLIGCVIGLKVDH
jgi:pyruvate dehydrogenase complex dehydrogenase (E1) component